MRTTVNLRDDLYELLIKSAGSRRNLSKTLNKILSEHMISEKSVGLFGKYPKLRKFVREERDFDRTD